MSEKPFYKSKKFVYALATFLAALLVTLLPAVADLDADTTAQLHEMLVWVFAVGLSLIFGHSIQDALTARYQIKPKTLGEAVGSLIEAIPLGERDGAPTQEHAGSDRA